MIVACCKCCLCHDGIGEIVVQGVGVLVSLAAIIIASISARRQNAESAKENRISLLNRRMEYFDLLKVFSRCLSVTLDSPKQCSSDGSFSAIGFSAQIEEYMRSNQILLQVLQENLVDFNVKGKDFFKEGSRSLIEKLNEGAYIFESEDIKKAIESLRAVFELAGGWRIDDGILLNPPDECKLMASAKTAIIAVDEAIKSCVVEMKI